MLPNNKLLDLSGKRAVVTGGGVGIGYGISYRLAEAGAQLIIADISQANLDEAKSKFKDKDWDIEYVLADVSKEEDVRHILQVSSEIWGGIDILVNNAGIYPNKPVMDMPLETFDKVIAVNLKSIFMLTKAAAAMMIDQGKGGKIINITSIDALHPSMVGLAHYDASKHGVWGFTKNVALELAPHGITVNAVAPGGVATPGTQPAQSPAQGADDIDMQKVIESFLNKIPMHRMGEPDEIGKVVLFLASDMSSYMTGSQIVVDGGVLLS